MTRTQKKNYFLLYSILFLIMAFAIYGWLWIQGKTFVGKEDGFYQHYHALMYYGRWLRQIVKTLVTKGRLTLPEWEFSMGYGTGVWATFHYYVIGDPLALLSAFVPARYTLYLYCFLVLLRNYLAGLTFSGFCFFMKRKNPAAVLAGAFTYVFCAWALVVGTRHPFFTNPMIYLPLVLLGAEKLLRGQRPFVFIFSVFLSAASNFYFFYMTAILTALYVFVRAGCLYGRKNLKKAGVFILKTGGCALVGVLLSMFVLFPVLLLYAQDYRSEIAYTLPEIYSASYYKTLAAVYAGSVSTENYTLLGYGAPALFAAVLTFLPADGREGKKKLALRTERILFALGAAFLMLPAAAWALNGFSYAANRWEWGYSLLAAFLLTDRWEELFGIGKRKWFLLAVGTAVYAALYHALPDMKLVLAAAAAALVLMLAAGRRTRKVRLQGSPFLLPKAPQCLMLGLVLAGLSWNAFCQYAEGAGGVMSTELMTYSEVRKRETNNPDALIQSLMAEDESFWRYTGTSLQMNSALMNGTRNTQFYWSLSNGNLSRLFVELEMRVTRLYMYSNLDSRTMIDTLAGVRYFVCKEGGQQQAPYGYSAVLESKGYIIYKNENALPLAYTYDSYVTEEQIADKNGVQKEEVMAQCAVLEEPVEGLSQGTPKQTGEELAWNMVSAEGVEQTKEGFWVTQKNATVTLQTAGGEASEVYLRLTGYAYEGNADSAVLFADCVRSDGTEIQKSLRYYPSTYARPSQMQDYLINLGYGEGGVETITLTFGKTGLYRFDTLSIYSQPMDAQEGYIEERGADAWTDETVGTDMVQGTITLKEQKLLCFSIPYDGGWTAYVDGEETELLKADYAFSALLVPEGEHQITLVYHTPGLKTGCFLTLVGLLSLAVLAVRQKGSGRKFLKKTIDISDEVLYSNVRAK